MSPWSILDTARTPAGDEELRLERRGSEFSIMLGTNLLMNNTCSGSEKALATLSCEKIRGRGAPHVLIGGLGMGFTLGAALAALGDDARVTVAELVPAVLRWARAEMAEVFGTLLDDARVRIHQGDVGRLIRANKGAYDAILLDVDNGPEGLTTRRNDRLYGMEGLTAAYFALRPGGVLAVWSAASDKPFTQRLKKLGYAVEQRRVRAPGKRGRAPHVIWLATRDG